MSRADELRKELAEIEAKEKADRVAKHEKAISALVTGMSYSEMCELREVLNSHIRSRYVYESDE